MPDPAKRKTLDQLKQRQRLLQILIFSLVTIAVWVGLSLFRTQRQTTISPELRGLAEPLTPTINQSILSELEQKRVYTSSELQNFPIYKFIVDTQTGSEQVVTIDVEPTPSPTATPTPSPSPTPAPTPEPESEPAAEPPATNPADNIVDPTVEEPGSGENTPTDQAV